MKKPDLVSPRAAANHKTFALRLTAAAAMAAVLGAPALAQEAKQASTSELETVVVTGARASAETAQQIKKKSDQVVDSIVAEDIGKFPDKNVAELLGRVTGVQTLRNDGEAGGVIVRGLGGVATLFNGREIFTAAGRNLYLADVPATMLKRIDVYKTQGADFVEGGTAGVIDVRTNRPFDFKGRQVVVALREEYRDKAKSYNPDISGMFSDRWRTSMGDVGFLLGLSHQRGIYQQEVGWAAPPHGIPRAGNTVDGVYNSTGPDVIGTDAMGRVLTYGDRKRDALNFSAQWRPNDDLEVYAEGFSTRINHDAESDFFVGVLPWWEPGATVTTVPGTNYMSTYSHPSGDPFTLSSTQARRDFSRGEQYALGSKWSASEALKISGELVHTDSNYKRSNPIMDTTWDGVKPVSAAFVNRGGYLTYPGGGVTDPNNFRIFQFFDFHNHSESSADDLRLDASYALDNGFFRDVTTGIRVDRRQAQYINEKNGYRGLTPPALHVPVSTIPGLACLSHATGGDYGFPQFVTPCRDFLLDNLSQARLVATGSTDASPDDPLSHYSDVERTKAFYVKSSFGTKLGGIALDGTAGVRVVHTEQTISGYVGQDGAPTSTPFTAGGATTTPLPSLALKATLTPELIARLIAGKAIERPGFDQYNPGLRLMPGNTTTVKQNTGVAGNPNLKPIQSNNFDATLEWYFNKSGSLTGTVFHHKFKDFLISKVTQETYGGITYDVSRPYNAQGAHLHGYEIGYRQFFDKLPGALSGLGMEANYTYIAGGLTDPLSGLTTDFPGMSKRSYNLVGLYEKGDWYARLAYNWRSSFVDTYGYRGLGFNLIVDPLKWLDASLGYKVNDQLTVSLDGSNLLNQAYHDYHAVPEQPRDVRRYDRVIGVSLRWKM